MNSLLLRELIFWPCFFAMLLTPIWCYRIGYRHCLRDHFEDTDGSPDRLGVCRAARRAWRWAKSLNRLGEY
jgi:hypothetical protein